MEGWQLSSRETVASKKCELRVRLHAMPGPSHKRVPAFRSSSVNSVAEDPMDAFLQSNFEVDAESQAKKHKALNARGTKRKSQPSELAGQKRRGSPAQGLATPDAPEASDTDDEDVEEVQRFWEEVTLVDGEGDDDDDDDGSEAEETQIVVRGRQRGRSRGCGGGGEGGGGGRGGGGGGGGGLANLRNQNALLCVECLEPLLDGQPRYRTTRCHKECGLTKKQYTYALNCAGGKELVDAFNGYKKRIQRMRGLQSR